MRSASRTRTAAKSGGTGTHDLPLVLILLDVLIYTRRISTMNTKLCKRCRQKFTSPTRERVLCNSCTQNNPFDVRFWSKVDKNGPVPKYRKELGPCWTWTGSLDGKGYGQVNVGGKPRRSHRVAWGLITGKVPSRKVFICHHCDNPKCVNPKHLFEGTSKDNTQDMMKKGRHKYITRRGEQHSRAILTEREVIDIRKRIEKGEALKEIAEKFKVSLSTISAIKHKRKWGWL